MQATTDTSHPLLFSPSSRTLPADLEHLNLNDLRQKARFWLDPSQMTLPRDSLVKVLRLALEDDTAAGRVLLSLSPDERAVASVYRRHGGSVDGEVIRLDLMARGLLEIVEDRITATYSHRRWKQNPIVALENRWALFAHAPDPYASSWATLDRQVPDRSFERCSLHAGICRQVEPAGPAPWSIAPSKAAPHAVFRRSPAEVALDLTRLVAYISGRGSMKLRKDGALAVATVRAMKKAVPLYDPADFQLPELHGLYCELLRYMGAVRLGSNELHADSKVASGQFAKTGFRQVELWARGWLSAGNWFDGRGIPECREFDDSAKPFRTGRQVVAWALGCLARAGDHWYELEVFISALHALQHHVDFRVPCRTLAWDPKLVGTQDKETGIGLTSQQARWFSTTGSWYANAVMVTLVALGLVERARLGPDASAAHGFRLTEIGRAVFGAPEVEPPREPAEHRCLLIQPNFDIVAYLDQADPRTAGLLGRLGEAGSAHPGPIQTFRLTQTSVYQAEESGLDHRQIVDFLQQHSQRDVPANVIRSLSDWSAKREGLSLRSGVTVRGFPTTAARDAYLNSHPGTACGSRFVLTPGSDEQPPGLKPSGCIISDHLRGLRTTLEMDEMGRIRTTQPVDLVQEARMRRITEQSSSGWQLTARSIRQAIAGGVKPTLILRWLRGHLAHAIPPLIALAIDQWLGTSRPLELGEAVLLHLPDKEQFQAIAQSPRLRPFLLGSPGPQWLLVKRETRKELAATLEELGFTLAKEHSFERMKDEG
ncbi:MAG: helicase-associated domain-containing protein [Isosphaerales bacterium]